MRFIYLVILLVLSVNTSGQNNKSFRLPSLIGDNMVLQQKSIIRVWGYSRPGDKISVISGWKAEVKALTDSSGRWQSKLLTPGAGGPYIITVQNSDTSVIIKNVLIGTVWFCSGQSNMEMTLSGWPPVTIYHSKEAIDSSGNYQIRLFTVPRALAAIPSESCGGKWLVSNPSNVRLFSATAYFFGKRLYEQLHIPVGLILASWGGTPLEAWMPASSLKGEKDFESDIRLIQTNAEQIEIFRNWLNEQPHFTVKSDSGINKWKNLHFNDEQCANTDFNDDKWPVTTLPQYLEQAVGDFDGVLWYRKKINIPEYTEGKSLNLSLGPIDDMDRVYINGVLVGSTEVEGFWKQNRIYEIPAGLMHKGENTLAIRVLDITGSGGIYGPPNLMKLTVKNDTTLFSVRLGGDWKFLPVAELINNTFYLYDIPSRGFYAANRIRNLTPYKPTTLFNSMVNPVLNYKVQGVIWYQGESNVGRAEEYAQLFPLMVKSWRAAWKNDKLPFYAVQIAPYDYSGPSGTESAELKESQASILKLKRTGLVVTLDLGVASNIHPPYKMEVGNRLAALALSNNFRVNIPSVGPVFKKMTVQNNILILEFDNIEGGLTMNGNQLKEFEIAGKDGKYLPASAKIVNNQVIVFSPSVAHPVAVRYCWHNGSVASLYNRAGLPASLFTAKIK